MHLKRAIVGLLALGGIWFAGTSHAQQAQGISSHVAVCNPKFPTQCAQPDANGALPTTGGGGGGGSTFTAAAAPFAVTAGTTKPAGISTFNSGQWIIPVKPGTTTEIDLTAPSGVFGVDGTTIASAGNLFPTSSVLQAGSNIAGKFGIDQTTAGTTNGVQDASTGATGSAVPSKAALEGLRAATALPAAVTDGQNVAAMGSKDGKTVTVLNAPEALRVRGAASTTGTGATTLIAAQGAGITMEISGVQCFRTDTATTALYVTLNDSVSTTVPVPPATSGAVVVYTTPLLIAANTALTFTASASITTTFCNAQGNQAH